MSDNRCFCSPTRSVFSGPKIAKHHGTKSPFGRLGPKLHNQNSRAYSKPCRECTSCRNQVLISVSATPQNFLPQPDLDKKTGWAPFKSACRCTSWTALTRAHMPRTAVRLGAIRVIVSVVLLISMASAGLCTPFRALYAWAANGGAAAWPAGAGPGEFQHLYAIHCIARCCCCAQQRFTWACRQTAVS